MSNVSICDGPPNWCRKMMCLARAFRPVCPAALSQVGRFSVVIPAVPARTRHRLATRDVVPKPRHAISMPQEEFLAIDQGPGYVLPGGPTIVSSGQMSEDRLSLAGRRLPRKRRQIELGEHRRIAGSTRDHSADP